MVIGKDEGLHCPSPNCRTVTLTTCVHETAIPVELLLLPLLLLLLRLLLLLLLLPLLLPAYVYSALYTRSAKRRTIGDC